MILLFSFRVCEAYWSPRLLIFFFLAFLPSLSALDKSRQRFNSFIIVFNKFSLIFLFSVVHFCWILFDVDILFSLSLKLPSGKHLEHWSQWLIFQCKHLKWKCALEAVAPTLRKWCLPTVFKAVGLILSTTILYIYTLMY